MFPFGQAQQAHPNEGAMREIEGMKQFFLNKLVTNGLPLGFWQLVQIVEWQGHGQLWCNDLHVAIGDDGEGCA